MDTVSFRSFADELEKIGFSKADLFKALAKDAPAKVRYSHEAEMHGGGFFDQRKNEIVLARKEYDVLAHEVGHAVMQQSLPTRLLQHPYARALSAAAPIATVGALLLLAKKKWWGPALPALAAAPTLISEALATRKGRQKLEETGASVKQLEDYRKGMWEGYKSYLQALFLPTA